MLLLKRHNIIKEVVPHLDSTNSIHCPIVVTVPVINNPGLTVLFRTYTRNGTRMTVLGKDDYVWCQNRYLISQDGTSYYNKMLKEFNEIIECLDIPQVAEQDALKEAFKLALMKTQSRYGREFEDSDFEMKLLFK